jgi:hypothetical protein
MRRLLAEEKGQMTVELIMLIPAVLLALVVVVNAGMFFAEAARFDRICGEVAQTLVVSQEDPQAVASAVLNDALGYSEGLKGDFRASVQVESGSELFLERRTLHFVLDYELFATGILSDAGAATPLKLSRKKSLCIVWSTAL